MLYFIIKILISTITLFKFTRAIIIPNNENSTFRFHLRKSFAKTKVYLHTIKSVKSTTDNIHL